jgi:hypothetical protein
MKDAPALLEISGPCMAPLLPDGAVVAVAPADDVRVGDVVAIAAGGDLTVHRVVARVGDRLVHQGDRGARAGVAGVCQVVGRVKTAPASFRRTRSAWLLTLGLWARYLGLTVRSARSGRPRRRRACGLR